MVPSHSVFPYKAMGYALLSQAIWLPLVAIDLHDRWVSRAGVPVAVVGSPRNGGSAVGPAVVPSTAATTAAAAAAGLFRPTSTGLLLGSASRSGEDPASGTIEQSIDRPGSHPGPGNGGGSRRSPLLGTLINPAFVPIQAVTASQLLMREFRPSELLGGAVGLNDIQAPAMPALALAERARWAGNPDPLAPLPSNWREPMRRALGSLPVQQARTASRLETARVVHVPSSRIRTSTDVPLALQSDGSVDILSSPDDPAVVDEIRTWSRRQQAPAAGSVSPAVVRLHPMPQTRPASPAAAISPPAAPAAPLAAAPALPPAAISPVAVPAASPAAAIPPPAAALEPDPAAPAL